MRARNGLTLPRGTKIPSHIAIIPDGNRRWARARGFHTLQGHKRGFERAVELGRQAREWGIHTVTLWGFSTENWDRTKKEIDYLMKLYEKLVDDYLKEAMENKVRIIHLGRKDRLPGRLLKKIAQALDINIATLFISKDVHVFDLVRLRRKYPHVDKLTPNIYMALGKVIQYARDIGFLK